MRSLLAALASLALSAASAAGADVHYHESATAVLVDPAPQPATLLVAGTTSGALDGNHAGGSDAWLAAYDPSGQRHLEGHQWTSRQWLRQWGRKGSDKPVGIALDSEYDIFVAGVSVADTGTVTSWLVKFNREGELLLSLNDLSRGGSGTGYQVHGITVGVDGDVYLCGDYLGADGDTDLWIARYGADGRYRWLVEFGSTEVDSALAIAADPQGGVVVAGSTHGMLGSTNSGGGDAWVGRFDAEGGRIWLTQVGGAAMDAATAVAVDGGGDVFVGGYSDQGSGGHDGWVKRLDDGLLQWGQEQASAGDDYTSAVHVTDTGTVLLAGYTELDAQADGQFDSWLTAFTTQGRKLYSKASAALDGDERVRGVDVDAFGDLFVVADIQRDNSDVALLKYQATGALLWAEQIDSETTAEVEPVNTDKVGELGQHIVAPATVDPAITGWRDDHYVYYPKEGEADARLFVHLPGSYGLPERSQLLLQEAAFNGHYAIGLRYPNDWTVGSFCRDDPDVDCLEKVRLEILSGQDLSTHVQVDEADAVITRLTKLLQYLDAQYPGQGWSRWLSAGGEPAWSSIILSGHSQGGGHAALLAKQVRLARVVMLASPEDALVDGTPAPWLSEPGVTPASAHFAFDQVHDQSWARNTANWQVLGIPGTVVRIETDGWEGAGSQRLASGIAPAHGPNSGLDAHGSVATDQLVPIGSNGEPIYGMDGVWDYLCCSE